MVKIIADSGCDIIKELKHKEKIELIQIPLNLQLGENLYIDDELLNKNNFVDELKKYPNSRKTSAPSPEKYLDAYKGDDEIFVVTLSSQLSGSYNSAVLAKNMYLETNEFKNIFIIDSKSASSGETAIVLKILEMINKNLPTAEIYDSIQNFVNNMNTYFILENYNSLVNTGRLNPYVAKIASILSIVPICGAEDGKTVLKGQARGEKRALEKLISLIKKEGNQFETKNLVITHVSCIEKAEKIKDEICKQISFKDTIITEASGLCSIYADYKGIIIAF